MGLFSSPGAVGLEFDSGVVRAVELKGTGRSATLTAAGQVEIPEDAVVEGVVEDIDAVSDALARLWSEAGIKKREVVLGVSNQGVMMRLASLPRVPEKKLAQVLSYQAGEYFPIPLAKLVFDFALVGESTGDNGPEMEILLVAARRDMLDKSLSALAQASLQPAVVDASPLALLRTLGPEEAAGTMVLVDISNGLTSLLLVEKGVPRFARVIPHSLQYMSQELNVKLPQVLEAMRRTAASAENPARPGKTSTVPLEWGSILAREISSSVGYYQGQQNGGAVHRVILSGRGARVPGLAELLQRELEIAVQTIDPLSKITGHTAPHNVDLNHGAPEFAVCIGLALRGMEV